MVRYIMNSFNFWCVVCLYLWLVSLTSGQSGKQYSRLSELQSAINQTKYGTFNLARVLEDDLEPEEFVYINRNITFQGHPGTSIWITGGNVDRLHVDDGSAEPWVIRFRDITFDRLIVEKAGVFNPVSFPYVRCKFCAVQLNSSVVLYQQPDGMGAGQLMTDTFANCDPERFTPKRVDNGVYLKRQYVDGDVCQGVGFAKDNIFFVDSWLMDVTLGASRYNGGRIVQTLDGFRKAMSNQKIRSIFVAEDLELYRQDFKRGIIDRNLRIYGDGKAIQTKYDSIQFQLGHKHVLIVENLKLQNLQVPVDHAFPDDPIFLAILEHNFTSGVRLKDCTMSSGLPSAFLNTSSYFYKVANKSDHLLSPLFLNFTDTSYIIDYWNISSKAWLQWSLDETDSKIDTYYEFENLTYTALAPGDYCKQTSLVEVAVATQLELRENLEDTRVRAISLTNNISLDDAWWTGQEKLRINRPVELVNCDQGPDSQEVVLDLNGLQGKVELVDDGYLMLRGRITLQNAPGDKLYRGNVLLPGFFVLRDSARIYLKETTIRDFSSKNISTLATQGNVARGMWPPQTSENSTDFGTRISVPSWYVDVAEARSLFSNVQPSTKAFWVFSDVWLELYTNHKAGGTMSPPPIVDPSGVGGSPGDGSGDEAGTGDDASTRNAAGKGRVARKDPPMQLAGVLGLAIGLAVGLCLVGAVILNHRRRHAPPAATPPKYPSAHVDRTLGSKTGSYARSSGPGDTGSKSEGLVEAGLGKTPSSNTEQIPVPVAVHSADSMRVPGASQGSISDATSLAEETQRLGTKIAGREGTMNSTEMSDIQLGSIIGTGSFGRVYKGTWRGIPVAVKVLQVPGVTDAAPQLRSMAVVESAVAATLHHPNIVQCYRQLRRSADVLGSIRRSSSGTSAGSLQVEAKNDRQVLFLVMEFCDRGNLRDAVVERVFKDGAGRLLYTHVCLTLLDVARAMQHLHTSSILHGDLKARNVLLKTESLDARGYAAKVADFGLAMCLDPGQTHVSAVQNGTMTHMAPEMLLHGTVSYASDVYAFGILMWEVFTGGNAYFGVPRALLGHEVAVKHLRPTFPRGTPPLYMALARRCWEADPQARPSFDHVLEELHSLLSDIVPGSGGGQPARHGVHRGRSVQSDDATVERRSGAGNEG